MSQDTQWAIVELMGHQKIAGRYSEHGPMYRIDVPDTDPNAPADQFRFTRLYSPAAIYSITFVDEKAARLAAKALEPRAITIYEVERELRRLAAPAQPGEAIEATGFEPDRDLDWIPDDDEPEEDEIGF